jgi:membrane protein
MVVPPDLPHLLRRHSGLGFLLAVSLVISTSLAALSSWLGGGESLYWQLVNFAISLAIFSPLFAMLFKWFPDAAISWRSALLGGLTTAVLFNIGKLAISWYIGTQGWSRPTVPRHPSSCC